MCVWSGRENQIKKSPGFADYTKSDSRVCRPEITDYARRPLFLRSLGREFDSRHLHHGRGRGGHSQRNHRTLIITNTYQEKILFLFF